MYYDHYHFWGMHLLWWIIWGILLFWIFATPYHIPGQRANKVRALDILEKRYATGKISKEEYIEKRTVLEAQMPI